MRAAHGSGRIDADFAGWLDQAMHAVTDRTGEAGREVATAARRPNGRRRGRVHAGNSGERRGRAGSSLVRDGPGRLDARDGSETLLRQLVANLFDNARTHNVPGGTVDVRIDRVDDACVLEVANTGPTVDPEVVDQLFEPFYRAAPEWPATVAVTVGVS